MALKENYKDDILDTSQNVKRKYQMENNGDGTVSFTDVTEYTQRGDSFGASDMNAVNSEVNEVVNNLGAKNMLPNNATTRTINGITFTVNSDGSVTVNGTASSLASLFLIGSTSAWGSNQYKNCILSGCPSGGSGDSYRIVMQTSSDGSATSKTYLEDGNGVLIDDDNQYCKIYIRIAGGYTANNLIFKPMIRPSNIKDDTYAPYAQTNKELTDNLSGFKFYPIGTDLVALVADDSFYTDSDGKYVLASSTTGQALITGDPTTYKSLASTEETHGEVGADTASPFKSKIRGLQYIDSKYSMNNAFFRSLGINNLKYKDKYLFVISHWNNTANEGVLVNGNQIPLTTIGYADGYLGASFGATSKLSESDIITAPSDYGFNAQLNILSDYPFELIHVKRSSQVITQNHKKWIGFLSLNPSYYNTLKVNGSGISGWTDLQNSGGTISLSFKDLTEYIHIGDTISSDSNGALLVGMDY